MDDLSAYSVLAHRLADAAGGIIRGHFRTPIAVDDKADDSPVTIADREAEKVMRGLINAAFPDHGIIGEEYGNEKTDAEWVWVLDPIDGTKSFITGKPVFGTLIALLRFGTPVLGVLDQPISRERWLGVEGQPSTLNGQPIHTRTCDSPSKAALYTTDPHYFQGDDLAAFDRLRTTVKLPRYGSDCYAYGLLAAGFVDVVCEANLKIYDFAALIPIIVGAGGVVTDWQGGPAHLPTNGHILASGDARTHAAAIALLKG